MTEDAKPEAPKPPPIPSDAKPAPPPQPTTQGHGSSGHPGRGPRKKSSSTANFMWGALAFLLASPCLCCFGMNITFSVLDAITGVGEDSTSSSSSSTSGSKRPSSGWSSRGSGGGSSEDHTARHVRLNRTRFEPLSKWRWMPESDKQYVCTLVSQNMRPAPSFFAKVGCAECVDAAARSSSGGKTIDSAARMCMKPSR